MNDKTRIRISVPAHLYESVKAQLTLKESKKHIVETITATDEELKDFYLRVKQIEAEGTDIDSAIHYALFDMNNPNGTEETSLREAKQNFGAGYTVVKEKKTTSASSPKNSFGSTSKKTEGESKDEEKTIEERVSAIEELLQSIKKKKSPEPKKVEETEKETEEKSED